MNDFERKFSRENYRMDSALKVARRNVEKDTLKASLKYFDIPVVSWEQTAEERSSGEVSSTKEQLSMKKAERKHRERKAKTNGPPSRLHDIDLRYLQPTV